MQLRNRTLLTLDAQPALCPRPLDGGLRPLDTPQLRASAGLDDSAPMGDCAVLPVQGYTQPPRPHETVVIRYRDPAGHPVYHEVQTDDHGCYEDLFVAVTITICSWPSGRQ